MEAKRLLILEPATIAWIDSFESGSSFWDIGANCGLYSLYAAVSGANPVYAFEPAAANLFLINKNIEINGLSERVKALGVAFSDTASVCDFIMTSTEFATASCGLEHNRNPMIDLLDARAYRQAVPCHTIDDFRTIFRLPVPRYMKIDVDGSEDEILAGAARTLADPALKSIQVEVDVLTQPTYTPVCAALERAGFVAPNFDALEQAIREANERAVKAPDIPIDRAAFDLRFHRTRLAA